MKSNRTMGTAEAHSPQPPPDGQIPLSTKAQEVDVEPSVARVLSKQPQTLVPPSSLAEAMTRIGKSRSAVTEAQERVEISMSNNNALTKALEDLQSGKAPTSARGEALKVLEPMSGVNARATREIAVERNDPRVREANLRTFSRERDYRPPHELSPTSLGTTRVISSAIDIGLLVRSARKKMRMSQQAFADLAGVGRRFISELESGKSTLEFNKVLRACAAAGVDLRASIRAST